MERIGFTREDLATFGIEEDELRVERVRDRVAPLLETVASRVSPALSRLCGVPLDQSIVLHDQPDKVDEAEIVFSPGGSTPRPAFAISVSRGGIHARLVIQADTPGRDEAAKKLKRAAATLARELSGADLRSYSDWDRRGIPAPAALEGAPFWREAAQRLARDSGGLDIGIAWPEAKAVVLTYEDLLPAFRRLMPLYRALL